MISTRFTVALIIAVALTAGCGSSSSTTVSTTDASDEGADAVAPGIQLVSVDEGAAIQADPPEGLVILDVRTPEEFDEVRLDGAVMLDFYRGDFAERLAELDPNVPYLLYCRSGNRSGQTAELMDDLGFTNVADVDGGITSWTNAGLATVSQ